MSNEEGLKKDIIDFSIKCFGTLIAVIILMRAVYFAWRIVI